MLFGVPLSLLGYNDGMSSPRGKISFANTQIKHSFNYKLLNRPQLNYVLELILSMSPPSMCRETVFYKPIRFHFSLFEERKDANRSSK